MGFPLACSKRLHTLAMAGAFFLTCGFGLAQPASAPVPQASPSRRLAELRKLIEADNRNHPVASVAHAEEALKILAGAPDPKLERWLLLGQARDLNTLCDYPRADLVVSKARALVAREGDQRDHFLLEVEAASILNASGNPGKAKALLDSLLPAMAAYQAKHADDLELGRCLGRGYRTSGSVARFLGRFPEAILAYQKGQMICEAMGDAKGRARILDQMGTLYASVGRFENAMASHKAALEGAEALKDPELLALFHLSLANTLGSANQPDQQLLELHASGEMAARSGDADLQLTVAVNMADAYLRKKDYKASLKFAEAGLSLALAANNDYSVAVCRVNRGIALTRLGSAPEGLKAIQEGLTFLRAQSPVDEAEVTGNLAEAYAYTGDYRKAYETEVQFKALVDALQKDQDLKNTAQASAAYENDKKELEIQALQRDRSNQAKLRLLWIALGALGFATAGVLVLSRKRLKTANLKLGEMSLRDPLTALANRRYLVTRIAEDLAQVARQQRNGHSEKGRSRLLLNIDVVFLMIDIDHFKLVNDQFGHAAGDQVLKQFAGILSGTMRDSDTVVRWGGEEFFVVAKNTSRLDAHLVAERIRTQVEAFPFVLTTGQVIHQTCSIGYASYPFFRTDPSKVAWEKVAELADQCLYVAKDLGRNTWIGVHEVEEAAEAFKEAMGSYPDVPKLVAQGILQVEHPEGSRPPWAG